MRLEKIFIGSMLLANGDHLIPGGSIRQYPNTSTTMGRFNRELMSIREYIHAGEVWLLKICREDDSMRNFQSCGHEHGMDFCFIPGEGSAPVRIDSKDAVLMHPLDERHERRIGVRSSIEKRPTTNLPLGQG